MLFCIKKKKKTTKNKKKKYIFIKILDNRTTAMTGMQENPGTGYHLDHVTPAKQLSPEEIVKGIGVDFVAVVDSTAETEKFKALVSECCSANRTSVIVVRRPCVLAAVRKHQNN